MILHYIAKHYPDVPVHYGVSLVSSDKLGNCTFCNNTDGSIMKKSFHLVIGADGAYSTLRDSMLRRGRVDFSIQYMKHGYKELCIPPVKDEDGYLHYTLPDHEGFHIWPRGDFMLIALPNPDKSFTATLFAPYLGKGGFDTMDILA